MEAASPSAERSTITSPPSTRDFTLMGLQPPDWPIEDGYLIEIYGEPNIRCRYEPIGTHVFDPGVITAMPTINAIPAVCAARPGIVTAADLPIVTAAGLVLTNRAA